MLAWIDVVLEFVVERLFFLVPELPDTLGSLAPNLKVSSSRCATARTPGGSPFSVGTICYPRVSGGARRGVWQGRGAIAVGQHVGAPGLADTAWEYV